MDQNNVTLGEVDRNVQQLRQELREGLNNVTQRMDRALDGTVPANVYSADKNAWEYRLSDNERELSKVKEDFKADVESIRKELTKKEEIARGQRNLVLAALIFPMIVFILSTAINFYFRLTGK